MKSPFPLTERRIDKNDVLASNNWEKAWENYGEPDLEGVIKQPLVGNIDALEQYSSAILDTDVAATPVAGYTWRGRFSVIGASEEKISEMEDRRMVREHNDVYEFFDLPSDLTACIEGLELDWFIPTKSYRKVGDASEWGRRPDEDTVMDYQQELTDHAARIDIQSRGNDFVDEMLEIGESLKGRTVVLSYSGEVAQKGREYDLDVSTPGALKGAFYTQK